MLLVVTNKADLASDYLILRLTERRIPFLRMNTEDFGERFEVDVAISDTAGFSIRLEDGQTFSRNEISAVYFRQPRAPTGPTDIAPSDAGFARRELKEMLRGLWRLIDADKWLNHPRNLWLASNKVEQLDLAVKLGLRIPETCVTSSVKTLKEFYRRHSGRIICKAVKHGFSQTDNIVTLATTKRVEPEYIDQFDDYAALPMIYQREILKAYDIRVTVIGNRVFATAIHSQEHPETEVDWRVWDISSFELRHEPIVLPPPVEQACLDMTSHFGLRYSAIDLVLDRDGIHHFLELNPNGQWAWIEKKAGYPIRDAIIDCLPVKNAIYA
jgi:glutathione synthase/RimK-type ligase-like ATP-grasp enzyme